MLYSWQSEDDKKKLYNELKKEEDNDGHIM